LTGLPALTSALIFSLNAFSDVDFLSGISVIWKSNNKRHFAFFVFWLQLARVRANGEKLSNVLLQHALENITAFWAFLAVDCAHHDRDFLGQLGFSSL